MITSLICRDEDSVTKKRDHILREPYVLHVLMGIAEYSGTTLQEAHSRFPDGDRAVLPGNENFLLISSIKSLCSIRSTQFIHATGISHSFTGKTVA
jgi:hypothetical protein